MPKKPSILLEPAAARSPRRRVLTHTQLLAFLEKGDKKNQLHYDPRLPKLTTAELIGLLLAQGQIVRYEFDTLYRCGPRYTWGDASIYDILKSLRPNGYLSHYSAAKIHGLTRGVPKMVYWNDEQSPKPQSKTPLNQHRIDAAFARPPRVSANSADYHDQTLCILSGKYTSQLGVTKGAAPDGPSVPVTDLERTLIDLTVRPVYAGGPREVSACYRMAASRVSVERLIILLKKLNYVYPYHQAVGFYLAQAGVQDLDLIRALPREFDFYLAHQIKKPAYSREWRLYYPAHLR